MNFWNGEWGFDGMFTQRKFILEIPCANSALAQPISNTTAGVTLEKLFPNPAQDELFLQFESTKDQSMEIEVYNSFGVKMIQRKVEMEEGITTIQFDISALNTGIYHVVLPAVQGNKVVRFLKSGF